MGFDMTRKLCAIVVLVGLMVYPLVTKAADLTYFVDMRRGLLDELGLTDTTNFYSTAKLNRFNNRGIKFVEEATKCNQVLLAYEMTAGEFRYPLPDSAAKNAVVSAFVLSTESTSPDGVTRITPRGLSYKTMDEFGKGKFTQTEVYTVWDTTFFIARTPSVADSLLIATYKVTYDLATDSAIVPLPRGWKRELALDYAYILCLKAEKNYTEAQNQWNAWKEKWQLQSGQDMNESKPMNPVSP